MSYSAPRRPCFDGPTPFPYGSVSRHVWGDRISGSVIQRLGPPGGADVRRGANVQGRSVGHAAGVLV
jgi:hypothetical protein